LTANDLLVIFTTNHGDNTAPHRLNLWGASDFLESTDLGTELAKSADYYCLGIFGHCYGTQMLNQLKTNVVTGKAVGVAASSSASHLLPPDGAYDAFVYHFTAALALETPSGYAADADAKKDGHIDMLEAFNFAKAMNTKQKITDVPDLQDNATPALALADKLTLEGVLP
jgi:hypothetical protein